MRCDVTPALTVAVPLTYACACALTQTHIHTCTDDFCNGVSGFWNTIAPTAARPSPVACCNTIDVSSFGSVDTDGDGCVSADELAQYQSTYGGSATLASLDTDGDGCVGEEEWEAYTGSFGSVDTDGDGCVSAEELAQYQSTFGGLGELASLDTDGDGCVSESLFLVAQKCMDPSAFMPDNTLEYECYSYSEDPAVEDECPEKCWGESELDEDDGTMKYRCICGEPSSAEECAEMYPGEQPTCMQRMQHRPRPEL